MAFPTGRPHAAEINVTPLIDVLLVLLIIFMMITPAQKHVLEAGIPQAARGEAASAPENPIVVEVQAGRDGVVGYRINGSAVERGDLRVRLKGIFAGRAEKTMFVQADSALNFDAVTDVIDEGHRAGVNNIGLLTAKGMQGL